MEGRGFTKNQGAQAHPALVQDVALLNMNFPSCLEPFVPKNCMQKSISCCLEALTLVS